MDIELHIYKKVDGKQEIEKTFRADTYDLTFGTVEDFIQLIDLEDLNNAGDTEFISAITKVVVKGFEQLKPILKEIFQGITDDELKRVKVKELIPALIAVLKFSFSEIFNISNAKKI